MKQTIETIAPGFSGFYASIWEFDDDYVIEDINEYRDTPIDYDDLKIDYKAYREYIGREYCNNLKELDKSILSVTFKEIDSPREYNFTTDKIVCDVTIDTDLISEWVKENREELAEYIHERFMPRDGFIPFYSNDIDDWDEATNGFTNFDFNDGWVYINGIMEVMFNDNNDAERDMYDAIERNYTEFVTNWDELVND